MTIDDVNDGLRRCSARIADHETRLARIAQQEAALAAERSETVNQRERWLKELAALDALLLILEAESGW